MHEDEDEVRYSRACPFFSVAMRDVRGPPWSNENSNLQMRYVAWACIIRVVMNLYIQRLAHQQRQALAKSSDVSPTVFPPDTLNVEAQYQRLALSHKLLTAAAANLDRIRQDNDVHNENAQATPQGRDADCPRPDSVCLRAISGMSF
jgi:hypothetical protein